VYFTTLPSAVSSSTSPSYLMQGKIMYRVNPSEDKTHINSHLTDNSLHINYIFQEVNGIQRKKISVSSDSRKELINILLG
jgi:hypothetical protein